MAESVDSDQTLTSLKEHFEKIGRYTNGKLIATYNLKI